MDIETISGESLPVSRTEKAILKLLPIADSDKEIGKVTVRADELVRISHEEEDASLDDIYIDVVSDSVAAEHKKEDTTSVVSASVPPATAKKATITRKRKIPICSERKIITRSTTRNLVKSEKKIFFDLIPLKQPRIYQGVVCAFCEKEYERQGAVNKWHYCYGCHYWACPNCKKQEWPCICPLPWFKKL